MTMANLRVPGAPGEWTGQLPPAQPFTVNALGAQLLYSGACVITGYSIQNGGAGSDVVTIYDGTDAKGQIVAKPRNATQVSDTEICGVSGVLCQAGIFVTESAGSTTGAIWAIPL